VVRMIRFSAAVLTAFTLYALYALAPAPIGVTPAQAAVVYCKAVGVPKGCVVRPTRVVVYCTAPGVPYGCVVRHPAVVAPVRVAPVVVAPVVVAPRVGVYRRPANLGGPVNRVGRR
jgi:hypothetical protein